MSFLAPLFLVGAAAVALPFLFHLIRRSSNEKIVFSSLMFLEPSPPRITKRSRLEHILLLLMRCAVIGLFAFVFARPFLPKPMAALPTPTENRRIAIVVDASASMKRDNLWRNAKDRAAAVVRDIAQSDSIGVYVFDRQLRTVLSFADSAQIAPGERGAAVEARLNGIEPSWADTHLGNAILEATEHLLEELNRDSKEQGETSLRIVVVSDFQSGAKLDGLQGFEWPKRFDVQLEYVHSQDTSNAGLQVLAETQRPFMSVSNAPVRLRISNSSDSKLEQFQVQWQGGPEPAQPIGEKTNIYVPPGQSRIIMAPKRPETAAAIMLSGDQVDFDNRAYVVQPKSREVRIAYLGSEPANDPQKMRYYVHRAFEQTNLATRVMAVSNSIPDDARSADLLILGATPSEESVALVKTLLESGRTILFPVRDAAQGNVIAALLGGVLVPVREAQVKNFALFGQISFQHPLFAPFSDARFSDFTKIHIWRHRVLDLVNVTNANIIASLDSRDPLLVEVPVNKGRLLLLATTWLPSDSQLGLSSKFVPLLFGLLEQSARLDTASHQFLIGEPVRLPPDSTGEINLPDGSTKAISGPLFSETVAPGVYRAGEFQFAVNLDPAESKLSPLDLEDFSSLGVPLTSANPESATSSVATHERQRNLLATDAEARQKLWRNFLLAAIAFIFLETWLSGRLSRAPVQP